MHAYQLCVSSTWKHFPIYLLPLFSVLSGNAASHFLSLEADYPAVMAWCDRLLQRPALLRGMRVCEWSKEYSKPWEVDKKWKAEESISEGEYMNQWPMSFVGQRLERVTLARGETYWIIFDPFFTSPLWHSLNYGVPSMTACSCVDICTLFNMLDA